MKRILPFLNLYLLFLALSYNLVLGKGFPANSAADAQDYILEMRGMVPHVGQMFQLRAVNKLTGEEAGRIQLDEIPSADFDLDLTFLEDGESYYLDFFADHNNNGLYDSPTTDHVWRLEADTVQKPWLLTFNHNTNFTEINWNYLLTLEFTGMVPHVGQSLGVRVYDAASLKEIGRKILDVIPDPDFTITIPGLELGRNYYVDFYADHNQNGLYDSPPADHAWREEFNTDTGNVTIDFAHNTNFTDIGWKYRLSLNFTGMVPHVGQALGVRVYDAASLKEVGREMLDVIPDPDFTIYVPGLELEKNYYVDFYADHNQNGLYDSPPTDHAWREEFNTNNGDAVVDFAHNTNFTDIEWKYQIVFNLTGMVPHVGQKFEVRVYNPDDNTEIARVKVDGIPQPEFVLSLPGLEAGENYNLDFYADHNGNGIYDAPPSDHAWREVFTTENGDAIVEFAHNTNFTDIDWKYQLAFNLFSMVPHVGQHFEVRIIDNNTNTEIIRKVIDAIPQPEFSIYFGGLEFNTEYRSDFYADHNGNGSYDSPPTDHAWREIFTTENGDAVVDFTHNTNFTDIEITTGIDIDNLLNELPKEYSLSQNYPNPFNPTTNIKFSIVDQGKVSIKIYNSIGQQVEELVNKIFPAGVYNITWNAGNIPSGVYFYSITTDRFKQTKKMILLR